MKANPPHVTSSQQELFGPPAISDQFQVFTTSLKLKTQVTASSRTSASEKNSPVYHSESPYGQSNYATPIKHYPRESYPNSERSSIPNSRNHIRSKPYWPPAVKTHANNVTSGIRQAGDESFTLILGIDFTKSNLQQGRNLHHLDQPNPNPYQQVISILGETMESFNVDRSIRVFGFGDSETKDVKVFAFKGCCSGFREVLSAYESVVRKVHLGGPTNFAPIINKAIRIVKRTRLYHILVIVSDGQVGSEQATCDAIVEASNWPLSIILVGVGDGPLTQMQKYKDSLPKRKFDNFQFVHFESVMPIAVFAFSAMMKIPDQNKQIKKLGL